MAAETEEKAAGGSGSSIGNKTKHVLSQMWLGMKRGAQLGAIGGAVVGGIMMATSATALAFLSGPVGFIGALLIGGAVGSALGMNTGGFIGGLKGLVTRAKPDGDAMMKEAEACAQLAPAPAAPQQEAGQALPAPPGTGKNPAHAAVGVTNPDAKSAGPVTQEALKDLKSLTQTLNQIQANAEATPPPQQPAQAQPAAGQRMQDWQARMRQKAQQDAAMASQR